MIEQCDRCEKEEDVQYELFQILSKRERLRYVFCSVECLMEWLKFEHETESP